MKRGYGVMITGVFMLVIGHFMAQWIVDSIPTINPTNSSMIADTRYHMLDWSNQLINISQWGIIILVIGGFVTVVDKTRVPRT